MSSLQDLIFEVIPCQGCPVTIGSMVKGYGCLQ
jgi:hypothetical protein